MTLIYPHWEHGRLIEGNMPFKDQPLPLITFFLNKGIPERTILEGLLHGEINMMEAYMSVPTIFYELVWYDKDNNTAYYTMAQRWRG